MYMDVPHFLGALTENKLCNKSLANVKCVLVGSTY